MFQAKIVIADDHPLIRTAMKQTVIEILPNATIQEASNFRGLLDIIEKSPELEIVFLDLHMPGNDGFTGLTLLQKNYPDLIVIMVSSDDEPFIIQKAIDLGATAFIPKSVGLGTITNAINSVLAGNSWLPDNIGTNIEQENGIKKLARQLAKLTPKQYEVLSLVADGKLNKQIASVLAIKENSVKQHVSAILLRLGVYNRTQAGLIYQQLMSATQDSIANLDQKEHLCH